MLYLFQYPNGFWLRGTVEIKCIGSLDRIDILVEEGGHQLCLKNETLKGETR